MLRRLYQVVMEGKVRFLLQCIISQMLLTFHLHFLRERTLHLQRLLLLLILLLHLIPIINNIRESNKSSSFYFLLECSDTSSLINSQHLRSAIKERCPRFTGATFLETQRSCFTLDEINERIVLRRTSLQRIFSRQIGNSIVMHGSVRRKGGERKGASFGCRKAK